MNHFKVFRETNNSSRFQNVKANAIQQLKDNCITFPQIFDQLIHLLFSKSHQCC